MREESGDTKRGSEERLDVYGSSPWRASVRGLFSEFSMHGCGSSCRTEA